MKNEEVNRAARPLLHFLAMWEAKPLGGMGEEFYRIHLGTKWEASLSLQMLRDLRDALGGFEKGLNE